MQTGISPDVLACATRNAGTRNLSRVATYFVLILRWCDSGCQETLAQQTKLSVAK